MLRALRRELTQGQRQREKYQDIKRDAHEKQRQIREQHAAFMGGLSGQIGMLETGVNPQPYPWKTAFSSNIASSVLSTPDGAGSGFDDTQYSFLGQVPDGEIREMVISFSRKTSAASKTDLAYGADDALEIALVYRKFNEVASIDEDTVLAIEAIRDNPLVFEDQGDYRFQFNRRGRQLSESDAFGEVPDYLRPVYVRVRASTDNASSTDYIWRNIDEIHLTAVFGSATGDRSLPVGMMGSGSTERFHAK